jgi:hypothetical protein
MVEVEEIYQPSAGRAALPPKATGPRVKGGTAVKKEFYDGAGAAAAGFAPQDSREAARRELAEKIRAQARGSETDGDAGASGVVEVPPRSGAEAELEDGKKLDSMIPLLEEKVVAAEDDSEKVSILAAPLQIEITAELQDLQMDSVRETEKAVRVASATLGVALRELEKRNKEVDSMAPFAKERGSEALKKISTRLESSKGKVDEHKQVRKDYELALAAEKDFGDLATRLAGVEIDCEKAAVMAEPLAKSLDINPEAIGGNDIRETKEALRVASATLAPTMRLISSRATGLKGAIRNKLLDLTARAETAQAMLDTAQKTIEEAQSRYRKCCAICTIAGSCAYRVWLPA